MCVCYVSLFLVDFCFVISVMTFWCLCVCLCISKCISLQKKKWVSYKKLFPSLYDNFCVYDIISVLSYNIVELRVTAVHPCSTLLVCRDFFFCRLQFIFSPGCFMEPLQQGYLALKLFLLLLRLLVFGFPLLLRRVPASL